MQGCAAENLRRSLFVCVKIMAPPVADILVLSPATVPAPNPGAVFIFAAFVAAYFLLFLSKRCIFAAKFCFSAKVFSRVRIVRARLHNYRNKIPFYFKFKHATLDYYVIFFHISKNFYNGLCKKNDGLAWFY